MTSLIPYILLLLLLLLYLAERRRYARLASGLADIGGQMEALIGKDYNDYIRITSADRPIMQLSSGINRMLGFFYQKQSGFDSFQKNMRRVLTDISHDLKTPLTVINGYTEILVQKSDAASLPEDILALIHRLEEKTGDIVHLINQFFTLAKLQSGDMAVHPKRTDVGRVCREIMLDYYELLQQADLDVLLPEADVPNYALADEEALKRILKNLIDNAVRYGREGRFLSISVTETAQTVRVCVRDKGPGFDAEDPSLLFQRNWREGGHRTPGSGLGLSICEKLAILMNASLSAANRPDGGAAFTLTLPKSEKKVRFPEEI